MAFLAPRTGHISSYLCPIDLVPRIDSYDCPIQEMVLGFNTFFDPKLKVTSSCPKKAQKAQKDQQAMVTSKREMVFDFLVKKLFFSFDFGLTKASKWGQNDTKTSPK